MTRRTQMSVLGLMLTGAAGACEFPADPMALDATGTVEGVVWLDLNGNARLDPQDGPVSDVRVRLRRHAGRTEIASASSTSSGDFRLADVPVGDYEAAVDSATVGDTLRILSVDSAAVRVAAEATSTVLIGLTYPNVPIDTARQQPQQTRLFIEGVGLIAWNTFGDASLAIRDTSGAILLVRVPPTAVSAGDSIRVLGRIGWRSGQPVLTEVSVFPIRTGTESPPPVDVATGDAATAGMGALDSELVRVIGAVVQDTGRTDAGDFRMGVDDGTGALDVVLDADVPFLLSFSNDIIGAVLDVDGILLPGTQPRTWIQKPRATSDVTIR